MGIYIAFYDYRKEWKNPKIELLKTLHLCFLAVKKSTSNQELIGNKKGDSFEPPFPIDKVYFRFLFFHRVNYSFERLRVVHC